MKFELKLVVIYYMSLFSTNAQIKIENQLSKSLLKGKIKEIKTISFDAVNKSGKLVKSTKTGINLTEYNENGFIIKVIEYNGNNKKKSIVKYVYDSKNNLIEKPKFGSLFICKYDANNFCIQEDECRKDRTLKYRTFYKYIQDSLLIEEITYDAKGAFYTKSTYKYDEFGNQIEESWHKENGELKYKSLKEYDENGNMIKEDNLIDLFGERGCTMTFAYNDKNKVYKTNYTNNNGMEYSKTTYYDEFGNIVRENSVSNSFINTFNYNYEYKYDINGNWIERKETSNGPTEKLTITEREITYY